MKIALVAHDEKKQELLDWIAKHETTLSASTMFATGTTGGLMQERFPDFDITRLKSGPLGGDQQIGALIAEQELKGLIFFIDPLSPHPHDVDIKALLRLAILYDIPFACNPATADFFVTAVDWNHEENN